MGVRIVEVSLPLLEKILEHGTRATLRLRVIPDCSILDVRLRGDHDTAEVMIQSPAFPGPDGRQRTTKALF